MTSTAEARPANSPLVLIIRDGWGENPNPSHDPFNAPKIAASRGLTPTDDMLRRTWPKTLIKTSGEDVGLPGVGPEATMGNSEVGHQNIGAGRIVPQESLVMTKACHAGLHTNQAIKAAIERCLPGAGGERRTTHERALHLLGINSDAGVHGLLDHLYAILRACKSLGLTERVYVHLFTDGRDTGPYTGKEYARQVEAACAEIGVGYVASVVGRYYAMDRDHRWERVALAYRLLTDGHYDGGVGHFRNAEDAMQEYYDHPSADNLRGDEFVRPRTCGGPNGGHYNSDSRIKEGDSVIFYNYRGDRPREISAAFCFPDSEWAKVKPSPDSGKVGFDRGTKLNLHYVIMTEYWEKLLPHVQGVAFPRPPKMKNIGGEVISSLGLRQFRCAETEKYPHVTFFFNDYRDEPFAGETRENPQSPKVATYDLKPEMAGVEVADAVLRRLAAADCEDFIVVNFANGDMVGHTGNLEAAIKACATVDAGVGKIIDATLKRGGSLIITADHGNCEQMYDPETKAPHTAHTIYDVPLFVVGEKFRKATLRGDFDASGWFRPETRSTRGRLGDILPTALAMMGLSKPAEMTGRSLLA
ncbi:MAG: 2,3-bisphosphoglycerate-independent phosphoglycerate mutase [Phycisphaerales bacterium]|jgi:2,3-bisphosphoglycerate-independent phosphoglycerate mutase|nr:2,3-bisphosphoglycerate-independent phosphoglycerate mutase [Phycisphaerales bacterium]